MTSWGGRRAQEWTRAVLANSVGLCVLRLPGCTEVATTGDHIVPRSVRPDLRYVVANGQPACSSCNSKRQAKTMDEVAALVVRPIVDDRAFFDDATPPEADRKSVV